MAIYLHLSIFIQLLNNSQTCLKNWSKIDCWSVNCINQLTMGVFYVKMGVYYVLAQKKKNGCILCKNITFLVDTFHLNCLYAIKGKKS